MVCSRHGLSYASGRDMATKQKNLPGPQDLCAACGFCCNEVIFANVKLQQGDDASRLRQLGLPLKQSTGGSSIRFSQPCVAHEGCRCRIYPDRPVYCRGFDCLLLQSVKTGGVDAADALRIIRQAQKLVTEVRKLLIELGDTEERKPLRARFRDVCRRLEGASCGTEEAMVFGRLTLAIHDLNLLLAERFYSG